MPATVGDGLLPSVTTLRALVALPKTTPLDDRTLVRLVDDGDGGADVGLDAIDVVVLANAAQPVLRFALRRLEDGALASRDAGAERHDGEAEHREGKAAVELRRQPGHLVKRQPRGGKFGDRSHHVARAGKRQE